MNDVDRLLVAFSDEVKKLIQALPPKVSADNLQLRTESATLTAQITDANARLRQFGGVPNIPALKSKHSDLGMKLKCQRKFSHGERLLGIAGSFRKPLGSVR